MAQDKTLSQKEIDALLSILPSDGESLTEPAAFQGSVRVYDFRSPDKFSKEQIRTLQMIHENFARRASSALAAFLRATVQLSCVHIEQGSFADFIQNVPNPSVIAVLKMEPLPGRILVTMDSSTSTVAIDRLLGGFGNPAHKEHEITDIEQSLLRGVIAYLSDSLRDAWRNVLDLTISIEETTLNPEFVQVALPSDAAIFLGFEVKIKDQNGMMSICIPYSVLKPIVSELSPHTWVAGEVKESNQLNDGVLSHLKQTAVSLAVLLGEISVDFEELLHLQQGDVLVLDTPINRPLPVLVGGRKKYQGLLGLIGNYMATQITDVVEEL